MGPLGGPPGGPGGPGGPGPGGPGPGGPGGPIVPIGGPVGPEPNNYNAYVPWIRQCRQNHIYNYLGFNILRHDPIIPFAEARRRLLVAGGRYQQYLSMGHFPEILKDDEFQYVFGQRREHFIRHVATISPDHLRQRVSTKMSRHAIYQEKLKQGLSFDLLAFHYGVSKDRIHQIFWPELVAHYRLDDNVPHRNSDVRPQVNSDQILQDNVVTDPFLLGFLDNIVPKNKKPVIFGGDHTYFYTGKFGSPEEQRRTFCKFKNAHCIKCFFLVGVFKGNIVLYGPQTGSCSPGCGKLRIYI